MLEQSTFSPEMKWLAQRPALEHPGTANSARSRRSHSTASCRGKISESMACMSKLQLSKKLTWPCTKHGHLECLIKAYNNATFFYGVAMRISVARLRLARKLSLGMGPTMARSTHILLTRFSRDSRYSAFNSTPRAHAVECDVGPQVKTGDHVRPPPPNC